MIFLIIYLVVAFVLFFRQEAIHKLFLQHSTNKDDSDGRLQMVIAMFWPIMIPIYLVMKSDVFPQSKMREQFQVLCADFSVNRILGTYNSEAEAMTAMVNFLSEGRYFSIRKVWIK